MAKSTCARSAYAVDKTVSSALCAELHDNLPIQSVPRGWSKPRQGLLAYGWKATPTPLPTTPAWGKSHIERQPVLCKTRELFDLRNRPTLCPYHQVGPKTHGSASDGRGWTFRMFYVAHPRPLVQSHSIGSALG